MNNISWYKLSQTNNKVLIIFRGLPGSGKSTLAKQLGKNGVVLGSDDFFMVDDKYEFDPNSLYYAHMWNQARAIDAMKKGISPIVIDNTNVQAWEMKPYVEAGIKYGYQIEIKEPNTPWKFDAEELAKRNTHKVPINVIEEKIQRWEHNPSIEDILKSERAE